MKPEDERVQRLQARFELIRQALALQYGDNFALAAAFGAWLMAMESAIATDFEQVCEDSGEVARRKNKQVRDNFMSFHKYICDKLGVEQDKVIDLLPSFKEILNDIIRGRG